jgi:uncharacterized membrane protein YqjE
MYEGEDNTRRTAASGLFRSLRNLVATLIAFAHTRLELLTTELQEEIHRAVALVIWGFVALMAASVALIFIGVSVIVLYWDSERVLAATLVTGAFVAVTVVAIVMLMTKIHSKRRLLDATRTELAKDLEQLESHR